jgi:hypothetical protein
MNASPMTPKELRQYIEKINAHTHMPGGQHNMQDLHAFFSADDGEPFYTVNLYKFHEKAQYLSNEQTNKQSNITGNEAYNKFSSVMIKLLLLNHSYPIFGSSWLSLSEQGWDKIVIVRYRSRRDMAEVFADPRFSVASEHKWASIDKHDRFVVKALHLPEMYMVFVAFIVLILCLVMMKRSSRATKKCV